MSKVRRICVVTGSRAEYGLLQWLMEEIKSSGELELCVVATGMHLSPEFGSTYRQIERNGFVIDRKVEMLLSSDSPSGISKSMGLGLIGFSDAYEDLKPDLVVVLGDRFEIFSAAVAALVSCIPIAHIHGGEVTEGAFDDALRHSITKMSSLHFVATEQYRRRVVQLGESPDRVFNVGALGVGNIRRFDLLSREEFENSISFKLAQKNLLVTFHPVTLEPNAAEEQFKGLLSALDRLEDTNLIFTKANADTGGRVVNELIDEYVGSHSIRAVAFASLGQLRYLSALKYVDGVIGNSSSGMIEAPSFKIGTVNVGDRQKGRIRADSVIDCDVGADDILRAIKRLYSLDFQARLLDASNPYGDGDVAGKIVEVIRSTSLPEMTKKPFIDIP